MTSALRISKLHPRLARQRRCQRPERVCKHIALYQPAPLPAGRYILTPGARGEALLYSATVQTRVHGVQPLLMYRHDGGAEGGQCVMAGHSPPRACGLTV